MRAPSIAIAPVVFIVTAGLCLASGFGVRGFGIPLLGAIGIAFAVALTDAALWMKDVGREQRALLQVRQTLAHRRLTVDELPAAIESAKKTASSGLIGLYLAALEAAPADPLAGFTAADSAAARRAGAHGNVARFCSGAVMFLGLLGSFMGIVAAVKGYQSAGPSHSGLDALSLVFSGLDNAFGTTIIGIIASLLLGTVNLDCRGAERRLLREVSDFVLRDGIALFTRMRFDRIADLVDQAVHRTLPAVVEASSRAMRESSESLAAATELLQTTIVDLPSILRDVEKSSSSASRSSEELSRTATSMAGTLRGVDTNLASVSATLTDTRAIHGTLVERLTHFGRDLPEKTAAGLAPAVSAIVAAAAAVEQHAEAASASLREAGSVVAEFKSLHSESHATVGDLTNVREALTLMGTSVHNMHASLDGMARDLTSLSSECRQFTARLGDPTTGTAGALRRWIHRWLA